MWTSFVNKDPLKNFAYEIGERQNYNNSSIWVLHDGHKLVSKEPVSIFVYEIKPEASIHLQELVKNAIKRVKILRHPNFIKFLDSFETDKFIYLVIERITPLETYLSKIPLDRSDQKGYIISWGLHQICIGLTYLINEGNLTHNNICASSIFVDKSGEWHLGGLEYVTPPENDPPSKVFSSMDKYNPPTHSRTPKWATDSWGLGCLIWEIFNGPLPKSASLQTPGRIPNILTKKYCELVGANPSSRPSPEKFLKHCRLDFMKNKFVDSMLFLEQIPIKDANELTRFYNSFPSVLDSFPVEVSKYKILQQIIHSFEYYNAGSLILTSLLKIGKNLDEKEYQSKIIPIVMKLFSSKDRATRSKLLQQIDQYIHHIPSDLVNDQIFGHIISGFTDANPTIREQTIKCILHLAPKLNHQNLDVEVMKHFARIQTKDEQGGIRTNTTVCLGKIANHLDPNMRQTLLSYAFARALKDPFPPARAAAILAFSATQNFYSLKDCATRVLPALCVATIDPEIHIRENAFKAIKGFLEKLEKGYEDPSSITKVETTASGQSSSTPSWAEWAMGALSSKFAKPNEATRKASEPPKITKQSPKATIKPPSPEDSGTSDYEDPLTDVDWASIEEDNNSKGDNKSKSNTDADEWKDFSNNWDEKPDDAESKSDGWDEANWGTFDDIEPSPKKETTKSSLPKSKTYDFGSLSVSKEESSAMSSPGNDWDTSWGEDEPSSTSPKENKVDLKEKREERREQRQRELELKRSMKQKSGGPLKLGARKVT